MAAVIEVSGLTKRYGAIVAVDEVTFHVDRGEIFGLLGPNGAGKTTTVEILEGLRRADGGMALVVGVDVGRDPHGVKERIGVQLQATAFVPHLTCREVVSLFASCYEAKAAPRATGAGRSGRRVDPRALLREVDLVEKADARNETLSGGQRQRLLWDVGPQLLGLAAWGVFGLVLSVRFFRYE